VAKADALGRRKIFVFADESRHGRNNSARVLPNLPLRMLKIAALT
jgi:hypothetical protein